MKKLIPLFCLCSLVFACSKNGDPFKVSSIEGNIYIEDDLFQSSRLNGAKVDVFISNKNNMKSTDPYILKTKSDDFGYFSFDFQPDSNPFNIFGEYRDTRGILFTGFVQAEDATNNYELILRPVYPEGNLQITVKDDKGVIMSGINTYLFVNKTQAVSVSETLPQGYLQTVQTSNGKGVVAFYNLKADTDYYIVAKNGVVISNIAKAIITADTLRSKIIKKVNLSFSTPSPKLTVTVLDSLGDKLNKSDVYVFSSLLQAQSVSGATSTITDYVETQKTNANGEAVFLTLKAGIPYYLAAKSSFLIKTTIVSKSKINPATIKIPINKDTTATIRFP